MGILFCIAREQWEPQRRETPGGAAAPSRDLPAVSRTAPSL